MTSGVCYVPRVTCHLRTCALVAVLPGGCRAPAQRWGEDSQTNGVALLIHVHPRALIDLIISVSLMPCMVTSLVNSYNLSYLTPDAIVLYAANLTPCKGILLIKLVELITCAVALTLTTFAVASRLAHLTF